MRDMPFSTSLNHLGFIYMRWFPGTSAGKESACNVGDVGLIPRLERSPGEGNGKPLQHSCLEDSMNRGAWQVHGVTKSWMRLSDFHFTIQFSHSVMSNSLWLHGLDHARLPYPSPTPGICSNSCPSSQWCYPTISPSVILSPPVFNLSQHESLLQWVGSSHQLAKVLELQHHSFQWIQSCFHLGLTGLISLLSKRLSRVFSNTTVQKHQFFSAQLSLQSNSHIHTWPLEKP